MAGAEEWGGFFLTPPPCSKGLVEAWLLPRSSSVLRQLSELEEEKEGKTALSKDCLVFYLKEQKL